MLQCTAFTELPEMGARVALMGLPDGPDAASEAPDLDEFLLCELGEHEEAIEHAAQLWSASAPAGRDLWMSCCPDRAQSRRSARGLSPKSRASGSELSL